MKKFILLILFTLPLSIFSFEQCSICTKTASQLGEGPAKALNGGIIYLMMTPFAIMGFIGYRWWKSQKEVE
jgi:hypothetical protein